MPTLRRSSRASAPEWRPPPASATPSTVMPAALKSFEAGDRAQNRRLSRA